MSEKNKKIVESNWNFNASVRKPPYLSLSLDFVCEVLYLVVSEQLNRDTCTVNHWQLSRLVNRLVLHSISLFHVTYRIFTIVEMCVDYPTAERTLHPSSKLTVPLRKENVVDSQKCFVNMTKRQRTTNNSFLMVELKGNANFSFLFLSNLPLLIITRMKIIE